MTSELVWRHESQIELSDGSERYRRSWIPMSPKRVMVLVHGYAEHAGRYDEMAMFFAKVGFAVHGYDQVGHGRTVGPRGHVDRFDRLVEEVDRFIDHVHREHENLPIVLVGHSMGGLVVAAAAAFRKPAVDKIVLSGALLQLGGEGGGIRQSLSLGVARVLSVVAPKLAVSTGLDVQGISRDPEVVRRYQADPLIEDRMSVRFAAGLSQLVASTRESANLIERPILILHGGDDQICPVAGSRQFFEGLSPKIADQSALKIYPNQRHEIFQEPERQEVWQDMLDWLGT